MSAHLSPHFSTTPFWAEEVTPFQPTQHPLPECVEVLIIGGGYAGLSAALTLAQAGCSVVVCEASHLRTGASSSSAGSLGNIPKAKLDDLSARYGHNDALQIYREARQAREYVEQLIATFNIDCDLEHKGRIIAAHSAKAFKKFSASLSDIQSVWGEVALLERDALTTEIGSTAFFGGLRITDSATLQPAKFRMGLAKAAQSAGAQILEHQRVTGLRRIDHQFEIQTPTLTLYAKNVIMATNAETGPELELGKQLRKRMTIVPAYALVTEVLSDDTMKAVLPQYRSFSDTYKLLHYMAPAGRSGRLVMSGRAGRTDGNLAVKAERIMRYFSTRFPALADVKVSHCWGGSFAVPHDWIPHTGEEDGLHYILGCSGTGVPMSTYLGHKTALKILKMPDHETAFCRSMPPIPYWPLNNWLLPLAARAYTLRDHLFR